MRASVFAVVVVVVAALASVPRPAHADGVADEAELDFQLGADAYRAGDYRTALQHFLQSNRLAPNKNVAFNVARSFERLGRFPDAFRWFTEARVGQQNPATLREIDEALVRLAPEVALVEVQTDPPGATLYVDRKDLGSVARSPRRIALPEGTHRILASAKGYVDATSAPITLKVGAVVPVRLTLRAVVGAVHVEADGPTRVRVDDEHTAPACTTPCDLKLQPGVHVLFFERAGFRFPLRQVSVLAGRTLRVRATASALVGAILVTADERDALVEVDGQPMGFAPVVIPSVPVGKRRVRVTLRGYEPIERTVDVREGRQSELRNLPLVPLREITTASRLPETLEDAPSSVSVITAQELEAFRYPTIYEALRGTRGMALTFDSTYSSIAVRGLGQPNDYGNRLLILQDGAVLNDNLLYQSFIGYDGRVDLGDVERIEIVRGPGSVLYGTGAVSGVVNLITHERDAPSGGWVGISANQTSVARGRAGFQTKLWGDASMWTTVSAARGGGRDVSIPGVGATSGFDEFDAQTVNGRIWWKSATFQYFYSRRDQRIPTGAFGTRFGDRRTDWVDQRALFELRFDPKLSNEARLFTRVLANHYRFDADYAYPGTPDTDANAVINTEAYRGTWFGGETRLVLTPSRPFRLSVGGETQINVTARMDGYTQPDSAANTYLASSRPYQVYAGYGLLEWGPVRWFRASAGARVDAWSTFGYSVNPRVALIFKPTTRDTVKLMGGRAFRAPSIYELDYNDGGFTQVAATRVANNNLQPETVWSSEVEYQRRVGRDWVALASSYVQLARSFIETAEAPAIYDADPTDNVVPIYYKNGHSDFYTLGGDLELRRELRSGWMFAASGGYLVARYTQAVSGSASRRVPNAPSYYGSVRGIIPVAQLAGSLATRLSLEAPRRLDLAGDAETDWAVVADVVLSGRVRDYGLGWAFGAYNLFNWSYNEPVADTFPSRQMPQIGRSFMASLDLTF